MIWCPKNASKKNLEFPFNDYQQLYKKIQYNNGNHNELLIWMHLGVVIGASLQTTLKLPFLFQRKKI